MISMSGVAFRSDDIARHDVFDLARMGLDELLGKDLPDARCEIGWPPSVQSFGADLDPSQDIAFAEQADELVLLVDNQDGTDPIGKQEARGLVHGRIRSNADDVVSHDVGGLHARASFGLITYWRINVGPEQIGQPGDVRRDPVRRGRLPLGVAHHIYPGNAVGGPAACYVPDGTEVSPTAGGNRLQAEQSWHRRIAVICLGQERTERDRAFPFDREASPAPAARPDHITYFKRTVTPLTAADTSAPTFGPLSCKITPLAFCN